MDCSTSMEIILEREREISAVAVPGHSLLLC